MSGLRAPDAVLRPLASRTRWAPETAADLLAAFGEGGCVWLHDGAGFATAGVAARIPVGTGPERLEVAAAETDRVLSAIEVIDDGAGEPGTGPLAVGALPFADGTPGELVVPALVVGRTPSGRCWITEVGPPGRFDRPWAARGGARSPGRPPSPLSRWPLSPPPTAPNGERFKAAVVRALERIDAGDLTKVVLACQVEVALAAGLEVREIVDRLRASYPSCFTFAVGGFVGSSPELLVRRLGREVLSRPMAGSVARTGRAAEDERGAAMLATSAKDLGEHGLVVDTVRRALEPVCREIVVEAPEVVRLATVAHLASTVSGRLSAPAPSALGLVGLLHPTPAVGGLPRREALAAIADLEGFDRGLYAGPVGWVDRRGDGEWAVALRCAQVHGDRAVLAAGAGIVAGSEPEAEWHETEAKLAPMLRALSPA